MSVGDFVINSSHLFSKQYLLNTGACPTIGQLPIRLVCFELQAGEVIKIVAIFHLKGTSHCAGSDVEIRVGLGSARLGAARLGLSPFI